MKITGQLDLDLTNQNNMIFSGHMYNQMNKDY